MLRDKRLLKVKKSMTLVFLLFACRFAAGLEKFEKISGPGDLRAKGPKKLDVRSVVER